MFKYVKCTNVNQHLFHDANYITESQILYDK